MSDKKVKNAIAAVMALGLTCTGSAAIAESMDMANGVKNMEKCYGVVKAGMNDCGAAGHNCAGEAKTDSAKDEWVFMPTGLCTKIVGGSTKSS